MKKIIYKILKEETNNENLNPLYDNIFGENIYLKYFKLFDKNPKMIFEILKILNLYDDEYESAEIEYNLIYKYLTEYDRTTNEYIKVSFDSDFISELFSDDDYGIQDVVKNFLNQTYDYDYNFECMNFDNSLYERIDEHNLNRMKEMYLKELNGEESEEDFLEFVENELGSEIGCAASDAQYESDIEYLHNDILYSIEDYLNIFNGKIVRKDNKLLYEGEIEIGDLVNSPYFESSFLEILENGYPEDFEEVLKSILYDEFHGWGSEYNGFLPEGGVKFNSDRHFRYGGAGTIDWNNFNEILSHKLDFYE